MSLQKIPAHDLPRERLERHGADALSLAELLAIILGTGTRNRTVLELSASILKELPLTKLAVCTPRQLCQFKGVSFGKAGAVVAAFELARRLQTYPKEERRRLASADDVVALVRPELGLATREHFIGLYLDARNCLLSKRVIAIGSLNASLVHPREIFKTALAESAAALVLVHNHPSGDPAPSDEDVMITKNLIKVGELIGIEVLDHVIVTQHEYYSFAESQLQEDSGKGEK